jgi:hypothetical protein
LAVGTMTRGPPFEHTPLIQLASALEAGGDWKLN